MKRMGRLKSNALLVAILATLLNAAAAFAWNEPEDFRGLRFGEDLTKALPQCSNYLDKQRCWSPISAEYYHLQLGSLGEWTLNTTAEQIKGRLAKVTIDVPSFTTGSMFDLLKTRYGEPTNMETKSWRSKAGATFSKLTADWVGTNVSIYFEERGSRVDKGTVRYVTAEYERLLTEKYKQERNKAAGDL